MAGPLKNAGAPSVPALRISGSAFRISLLVLVPEVVNLVFPEEAFGGVAGVVMNADGSAC